MPPALRKPTRAASPRRLVQTSLWGIDSRGIARLPHDLNRIAHDSIRARPNIVVTPSGPCTAQVAGDAGLGIVVAWRANEAAMQMARASGIGAVGLYSRAAARAGLIGMAFTHSDSIAAPFGGHRPFFGTNPVSVAFPQGNRDSNREPGGESDIEPGSEPLCLDMATTSIPWNRVMNARREGLALPPDVAVDAQGGATQDALSAAALRPLGGADYGHKGDDLALINELQ